MTDAVNAGPTGTTSSGVSPTADAGTMAQAAAAMSAAATSLSENMAKFASLTENIQKIANSIADANSDSNDSMNDARSIANDFDTTHAIGGIEAMRNHMARVVHESGNDSMENARRSRNWFDKQVADVLAHDNDVRAVITAGLRNSTESDNMVAKQSIRHADTQLFQTSMGEGGEVNMGLGAVVNDLLAATKSLQAVVTTLAPTPVVPATATKA